MKTKQPFLECVKSLNLPYKVYVISWKVKMKKSLF